MAMKSKFDPISCYKKNFCSTAGTARIVVFMDYTVRTAQADKKISMEHLVHLVELQKKSQST